MSHFMQSKTKISDPEAIVRALMKMGFTRNQIEVHTNNVGIQDYYKGTNQASIVIRRQNTGIPSDIGFRKEADGTYTGIYDEFNYGGLGVFNKDWQKKFVQHANNETCKIALEKQQISFEEITDKNGDIVLTCEIDEPDQTDRESVSVSI